MFKNVSMDKNNLGYLGSDFQYRLVSAFIDDAPYFKMIYHDVDQNVFTEPGLRNVVGILKDYMADYGSSPSYTILLTKIKAKLVRNEDDSQFYEELTEKLRKISTEGIEEIEKLAEQFFKQQALIAACNKALAIVADGDMNRYPEVRALVENALRVGKKKIMWTTPFESIEGDLSAQNTVFIPTGVPSLDRLLGGGIEKKKIGVIMGSMGFGKTSMTTYLAAFASRYKCPQNYNEGFKVLQIVFEDTPRDLHRKYFSNLSGVETRRINESDELTQMVREAINLKSEERDMMNNNIHIIKLDSGAYTASQIKDIIKEQINYGFKPDLVIVDYFGCLLPETGTGNQDITVRESTTMRKFENMATELDIAMWIPVQSNRDGGTQAKLVGNENMGGSIAKGQIAHIVMTITRSIDDIKNNRATIAVTKNRSGGAGETLNDIMFDNGTCTISEEEMTTFESVLEYNEYAVQKEEEMRDRMIQEARMPYKLAQK